MAAATTALIVSKGRHMLTCEPVDDGNGNTANRWAVYAPNGIRYESGFVSAIGNSDGRVKAYVSKISDRNGNEIHIEYAVNSFLAVYIKTVSDPADGRNVQFNYLDENFKSRNSVLFQAAG